MKSSQKYHVWKPKPKELRFIRETFINKKNKPLQTRNERTKSVERDVVVTLEKLNSKKQNVFQVVEKVPKHYKIRKT